MKIDPKGRTPPKHEITEGSMNHLLLGIGRGTAFTLHGGLEVPEMFLPRIVPTRLRGRITKNMRHSMAICVRINALIRFDKKCENFLPNIKYHERSGYVLKFQIYVLYCAKSYLRDRYDGKSTT